jgi:hypothetical protein
LRGKRRVALAEFLHDQRISLEEIYRESKPSGWTTLLRSAGLLPGDASDDEATLSRRLGNLLHLDDPAQLAVMRRVAEARAEYTPDSASDRVRAQMLAYQIDSSRDAVSYESMLARFAQSPACADELGELADVLGAKSRIEPRAIPGLEDVPLQLHGSYRIREILTSVGYLTADRRTPFQAGVLALQDRSVELLFVTLDKSEGFHDRIAYHDYAVSPHRFHWQTQNTAGPHTKGGRRYLESATNGWTFQLFVRLRTSDPYRACGPVRVASADDIAGDRPMSITWTLGVPLPPKLFGEFSVLRGQA